MEWKLKLDFVHQLTCFYTCWTIRDWLVGGVLACLRRQELKHYLQKANETLCYVVLSLWHFMLVCLSNLMAAEQYSINVRLGFPPYTILLISFTLHLHATLCTCAGSTSWCSFLYTVKWVYTGIKVASHSWPWSLTQTCRARAVRLKIGV